MDKDLDNYLRKWGWLGEGQTVWPVKSCQMSIKIAQKWFLYKIEIFWHFYKKFLTCEPFGQNNCCQRLWKVAQSAINHPIWSHWGQVSCFLISKQIDSSYISTWCESTSLFDYVLFTPIKHLAFAQVLHWELSYRYQSTQWSKPTVGYIQL